MRRILEEFRKPRGLQPTATGMIPIQESHRADLRATAWAGDPREDHALPVGNHLGSDDPAAFVDGLIHTALQHRALTHPHLRALAEGTLPDPHRALADFACHYQGYSCHFPRFLTALISRLENPAHRQALLENLTEESGHYDADELQELGRHGIRPEWILGIPHPQLFQRFRRAVMAADPEPGEPPEELPEELEVVCWRELLLAVLSGGSAAEAVGALGPGTEAIVPQFYQPLLAAIKRLGTLSPQDTAFFPLHTLVDDRHQATLRAIACDFATTATGRADLARGMHKALALRDSILSWLHHRALAMAATTTQP